MRFSICTPVFRGLNWLKLCVPSVADQGVEVEHLIHDAASNDGTVELFQNDPRVKLQSERDQGMYDGLNRCLRRAQGDIVAQLNCDEQYLPGALQAVEAYFEAHPNIQVLFADAILLDDKGEFICYRKTLLPQLWHTQVSHLCTLTCSAFFRRSILDEHNAFFDPKKTDVGDADWVIRLLKKKVPMGVLRYYTSAFIMTGANRSKTQEASNERRALFTAAPLLVQKLRFMIILHHRMRRLMDGAYTQKPFHYSVYTPENPTQRSQFFASQPRFGWPV